MSSLVLSARTRRLVLDALVIGFGAGLALLIAIGQALASEVADHGLLLRHADAPERRLAAPLVATEVDIRVAGVVARAAVRQVFVNPEDAWVEGVYIFPLPETGAVDSLRMQIGERVVEGVIAERGEARRSYEAARDDGRRASLIESERPNIFTASVANVGPGETVAVEIEYQETLSFRDGRYSLRFPMVVAPRYIPAAGGQVAAAAGAGWAAVPAVEDAARISPPVLHPAQGPVNPLRLAVTLDAGLKLADLASPSHRLAVSEIASGGYRIALADGSVPTDRDFVLDWRPETGAEPRLALFTERHEDGLYLLATLQPPERPVAPPPPREAVFVVDASGSMHGPAMEQARQALLLALQRLRPEDRFNVVAFNHAAWSLFTEARAATPAHLDQARGFVRALRADGGTEMLPAMGLALDGASHPGRIRQIVFMTDGSVGNEAAVLERIGAGIGDSRLFTVGLGAAPNGWFMRKAAETGRGTFTFVADARELGERMGELFVKLERPVATDLAARFPGAAAEAWPARLPDLHSGEPVTVAARLPAEANEMEIAGRLSGHPWLRVVSLANATPAAGIAKEWARRKIDGLMDGLAAGEPEPAVRAAVVEVALAHRLVSRYTSLVAVDQVPVRPQGAALQPRAVPLNMPAGMSFEHVFGPQGGTDQAVHLLIGALLLQVAAVLYLTRRRGRRP